MTDTFNKKLLLGLAGLVAVVNVWVLTGVWLNKAETTSTIVLSERELDVPYFYDDENSGLSLRIDYRVLTDDSKSDGFYVSTSNGRASPIWLNKEKMLSLDFSEKELSLENADNVAEKEVFLVLELDGEAHKKSLAKVRRKYEQATLSDNSDEIQNAKRHLQREENNNSRLFAIDADLDLQVLQARYQHQTNIFISKAVISANWWQRKSDTGSKPGRIDSLSVSHLYVPYPLNEIIKSLELRDYDDFQSSRFDVDVNIGAHLIPWISDVKLTGS